MPKSFKVKNQKKKVTNFQLLLDLMLTPNKIYGPIMYFLDSFEANEYVSV